MTDNIFGTLCKVLVVVWTLLCVCSCTAATVVAPVAAPIGVVVWLVPTVVLVLLYFVFGRTATAGMTLQKQQSAQRVLALLLLVIVGLGYLMHLQARDSTFATAPIRDASIEANQETKAAEPAYGIAEMHRKLADHRSLLLSMCAGNDPKTADKPGLCPGLLDVATYSEFCKLLVAHGLVNNESGMPYAIDACAEIAEAPMPEIARTTAAAAQPNPEPPVDPNPQRQPSEQSMAGIRAFCVDAWGDSFSDQEECIADETESLTGMFPIIEKSISDPITKRIMAHCIEVWGSYWTEIANCYEEQRAAYERLHPAKPMASAADPATTPRVTSNEKKAAAPKSKGQHAALKARYEQLMGRCGAELGGTESEFPSGFCAQLFTVEGLRSFCTVMAEHDWLGEAQMIDGCDALPEREL